MGKRQCDCGSYLFYIYEQTNGNVVKCIREENNGYKGHKAMIEEKMRILDE